jgi:hypothetical protein
MPTINLSVRFSDRDIESLDRLVVANRVFYESQAQAFPAAAQMAREATRSSAIRDLLLTWERGEDARERFSRNLARPTT